MAERVQTGGMVSFNYGKGHKSKLSEHERRGLEEAYQRARERKARERKKRIISAIIFVLLVLLIIGLGAVWYFLR